MRDTYPDPMRVPYVYIEDTAAAVAAVDEMASAAKLAIDTETEVLPGADLDRDGPGPWVVLSAAAAFADGSEKVWVINMTHLDVAALGPGLAVLDAFAWNASFERRVFARAGVSVARWWDLMLYKAVLDQGRAVDGKPWYTGLAEAAATYLGVDVEGKGGIQLSYKRGVPLSDEQKAYAAQDAIVTLWLEPLLTAEVDAAGLSEVAELECRAQPFIDGFVDHGLWIDRDGWLGVVAEHDAKARAAAGRLAELTGGGQFTLFSAHAEPAWKPGSPEDVKRVLNEHATEQVRAYFAATEGQPRLLGKADSVDADRLAMIGGPLAEALNEWSEHTKVVSTYGTKWLAHAHDDQRFHARYLQALVDTGRLSSDRPNLQNCPAETKRHMRPTPGWPAIQRLGDAELAALVAERGVRGLRVFVAGDLSQAELRMLAQVSNDANLRASFAAGEDLHVATASRMFGLDMLALKAAAGQDAAAVEAFKAQLVAAGKADLAARVAEVGPEKLFAEFRAKGKTLNFGVVYGLRAASLAVRLTVGGVPTTKEEASELLRLYDQAYPGVAGWLAERDRFIADLAKNPPACDWDATWRLHRAWPRVKEAFWAVKKRTGGHPSPEAVAEEITPRAQVERDLSRRLGRDATADEVAGELAARAAFVAWVRNFKAPVVVLADGTPFTFESRTPAGRRRRFEVTTDDWLSAMMLTAARSTKARPARIRDAWAAERQMSLSTTTPDGRTKPLSPAQLRKRFEGRDGKALKEDFVCSFLAQMPEAAGWLMQAGLAECIRAMGNQYRNSPIQGGVADAVLHAYGLLDERLRAFDGAYGVQSVHDSIVVECALEDAPAIAELLRATMQEGLARYCPDVPVVADVDIQTSLDAKQDTISVAEAAELLARARRLAAADAEAA